MKQTMMIPLPARRDLPSTSIYTETYTKNALGGRDTLILVPGGPGNDRTMYDTPVNSIAKSLSPYVDIILFDPRGCGNSETSEPKYCTLEHYIDDLESNGKALDKFGHRVNKSSPEAHIPIDEFIYRDNGI